MSLKERLQNDWKMALKAKDKFKANVISMAKAAVLQIEKTDGVELNDEQIISVLAKEVKSRKDSISDFKKGNRQDLIDETQKEIDILLGYLPQQLNECDILDLIKEAINSVGANSIKDMKKVMSYLSPKIKGRADGKLVSKMVKEFLNK